jgi:hypothetical protein
MKPPWQKSRGSTRPSSEAGVDFAEGGDEAEGAAPSQGDA